MTMPGTTNTERPRTPGRKSGLILATVSLGVSLMAIIGALLTAAPSAGSDPGPASYPLLVAGLMLLCSVLLLLERSRPTPLTWGDMKRVVLVLASLLLYFVLLSLIGFVLASFVFTLAALLLADERRIVVLVLYSVGLPIAVYAVFSILLGLLLPMGPVEVLL